MFIDVVSIHGPAKEFRIAGSSAVIGFIATMSEHSCTDCNRLRLTSDGNLCNCLFAREEVDLSRLLRAGASRDVIEVSIRAAVILEWEHRPDVGELTSAQNRAMVVIGGEAQCRGPNIH